MPEPILHPALRRRRWTSRAALLALMALSGALSTAQAMTSRSETESGQPPFAVAAVDVADVELDDVVRRAARAAFSDLSYPDGETVPLRIRFATPADIPDRAHNFFAVRVRPDGIVIRAADRAAGLYAVDWLAAELRKENGRLRPGEHSDYSPHEVRGLHIVTRRTSEERILDMIRVARESRLNMLMIHIADGFRTDSPAVPAGKRALEKDALVRIAEFARANGMEVIPQLALLTHQDKFFGNAHRDLMYNKSTYDPRQPEVYELVFEYIEELIELLNPRVIHIGHDEVAGLTPESRKRWLRPGEEPLPPDLFLDHVLKIHAYLDARNIETWMWGDMFLLANEFPLMKPVDMNGLNGYAELRGKIPDEIVICDWRYYQRVGPFQSVDAFIEEGHRVIGSTFKQEVNIRHFSQYMASREQGSLGMLATTWYHVLREEWELVYDIIRTSGRAYWSPGG